MKRILYPHTFWYKKYNLNELHSYVIDMENRLYRWSLVVEGGGGGDTLRCTQSDTVGNVSGDFSGGPGDGRCSEVFERFRYEPIANRARVPSGARTANPRTANYGRGRSFAIWRHVNNKRTADRRLPPTHSNARRDGTVCRARDGETFIIICQVDFIKAPAVKSVVGTEKTTSRSETKRNWIRPAQPSKGRKMCWQRRPGVSSAFPRTFHNLYPNIVCLEQTSLKRDSFQRRQTLRTFQMLLEWHWKLLGTGWDNCT